MMACPTCNHAMSLVAASDTGMSDPRAWAVYHCRRCGTLTSVEAERSRRPSVPKIVQWAREACELLKPCPCENRLRECCGPPEERKTI
mgnify:CR=1 FL=1